MVNKAAVAALAEEFQDIFSQLCNLQFLIRKKLVAYADGKNLKGNEHVGWLGEIYAKLLLNGRLVDDKYEHDVETDSKWRVSVKTRRGWNTGWQQTSAIPKYDGAGSPTHLLFVHLNDDYSPDRIWLFGWLYLCQKGRFRPHIVRGSRRSYIFKLDERVDDAFVVFRSTANHHRSGRGKTAPLSSSR